MIGCTAFLVAMMTTPDEKLAKADPAKLASKYQVDPQWAAGSIRIWLGRAS